MTKGDTLTFFKYSTLSELLPLPLPSPPNLKCFWHYDMLTCYIPCYMYVINFTVYIMLEIAKLYTTTWLCNLAFQGLPHLHFMQGIINWGLRRSGKPISIWGNDSCIASTVELKTWSESMLLLCDGEGGRGVADRAIRKRRTVVGLCILHKLEAKFQVFTCGSQVIHCLWEEEIKESRLLTFTILYTSLY